MTRLRKHHAAGREASAQYLALRFVMLRDAKRQRSISCHLMEILRYGFAIRRMTK